jgi:hypothetical protein
MGIRDRKNHLILVLKARALGGKLTTEHVATFERMYRGARSEAEQDEVTKALDTHMNGWKTDTSAWSVLLRSGEDGGFLSDDEDEDPPALKAALARSQVFLGKKPGVV